MNSSNQGTRLLLEGRDSSQQCQRHEIYRTEETAKESAESIYTLCSQQSSSNLTASDLPGAGRTLGLLYSRWGRALEASVGRLAHRSGFGPDAVASRIERVTFKGTWIGKRDEPEEENRVRRVVNWSAMDGNETKLRADCQKLAAYALADVSQTRMRAVQQVIRLITGQPRLRTFFRTPSVLTNLQSAARPSSISSYGPPCWEDELKNHLDTVFLAKQALLSIEDNPMNDIVDDILQLPFLRRERSQAFTHQYTGTMSKLLEYCWNPRFSFVAKRHMCSALNYLPWVAICQFSSALVVFLEQAIAQALDPGRIASPNEGMADLDGTERLAEVLLLPRCRAVHTLDPEHVLHLRPHDHPAHCRCTNNANVHDEMRGLLVLLKNPTARDIFPRAAAIAGDVWQEDTDAREQIIGKEKEEKSNIVL